ncbi:translation initiation factor IF-2 N-terminal domain-containing protein, partial [Cyanobium sp. LEGE 06143]
MTSSGKVRIYELSRDLGLENKDVLDAAEKLGVAAKSHSSSISDGEASQIRRLIQQGTNGAPQPAAAAAPRPGKAILAVQKAAPAAPARPATPAAAAPSRAAAAPARPAVPAKPPASPKPPGAESRQPRPTLQKPAVTADTRPVVKP